jgi:acyl dehydratase
MADSVITGELRSRIGVEAPPMTIEIEKGMLRRLAEAVEDPNPLWQDEAKARKSRYGGITAPPALLCSSQMRGPRLTPVETRLMKVLDGGIEIEFYEPIRPNDVITIICKISDLYEKETKLGLMLFQVTESRYVNQLGEAVATQRSTVISY